MAITQNHIAEFLALIVSVIFWKDIKKGKLRWLPFFLFFILCIELTGTYFKRIPYANAKLYNFSIPLEYLFYLFLFWLHGGKALKNFSSIAGSILIALALLYFAIAPFRVLHDNVLLFGQLSVIVCSCIYLFKKFQHVDDDPLLHDYFFWILSGLMIFNLEDFTYFFLLDIIQRNNWDKHDNWFKAINSSLIILLYSSYIIAILVYRKRKNYLPNAQ